jgi:hypothetical protein
MPTEKLPTFMKSKDTRKIPKDVSKKFKGSNLLKEIDKIQDEDLLDEIIKLMDKHKKTRTPVGTTKKNYEL